MGTKHRLRGFHHLFVNFFLGKTTDKKKQTNKNKNETKKSKRRHPLKSVKSPEQDVFNLKSKSKLVWSISTTLGYPFPHFPVLFLFFLFVILMTLDLVDQLLELKISIVWTCNMCTCDLECIFLLLLIFFLFLFICFFFFVFSFTVKL